MLSLGCERLPTHLKKKKKKKKRFWIITFNTIWVCYHYYGVFFAHLLILQNPDHHQNLISSSLYYSGPVHKISSQSVHNFLSNVVHRQTNRQTDRQTNQRYQKHNLLCQGGNEKNLLSNIINAPQKYRRYITDHLGEQSAIVNECSENIRLYRRCFGEHSPNHHKSIFFIGTAGIYAQNRKASGSIACIIIHFTIADAKIPNGV